MARLAHPPQTPCPAQPGRGLSTASPGSGGSFVLFFQQLMLVPEMQAGALTFRLLSETAGVFPDWAGPLALTPDGGLSTLAQRSGSLVYYECPRR